MIRRWLVWFYCAILVQMTVRRKLNPDDAQAQKLMAQLKSGKSLSTGDLQILRTLAEESAAGASKTQKNTAEVGVKYSLRKSADNQVFVNGNAANEHVSVTPEDVTNMLKSKRVNSKTAVGIAEAVVARLNGHELTRTQRERLSSALGSPTVQSVISELLQKKSNGIDSVQNDVYDNSNIRDGLTNEERAASWNLSNPSGDVFSNYDDTTVTEDSPIPQSQNASLEGVFGSNADVITDGSHLENGKLKPNVTYKTGEHDYFYTTNEDGLIVNARTDDLQWKTHERRLRHNPNTYGKASGDHAGHLFGDRFGGSPELDNLVSQAKNVNQREYRQVENQWAKALENGQKVRVNINIHYDQVGVRPSSFDISYTIDDVSYNKKINNQLGGSK